MSVNKYNNTTGQLETLASGQRIWVGSKEAHDTAKQAGTLPTNCLIAITDDEEELAQEVIKDDPRAVTSGAVYNAMSDLRYGVKVESIAASASKSIEIPIFKINRAYIVSFLGSYPTVVGGSWLILIGNTNSRFQIVPLYVNNIAITASNPIETLTFTNNYTSATGGTYLTVTEI